MGDNGGTLPPFLRRLLKSWALNAAGHRRKRTDGVSGLFRRLLKSWTLNAAGHRRNRAVHSGLPFIRTELTLDDGGGCG